MEWLQRKEQSLDVLTGRSSERREGRSQGRKEVDEGGISVSYCQVPEKQVEDEGKAFGFTGVVLGEWCSWTRQNTSRVGLRRIGVLFLKKKGRGEFMAYPVIYFLFLFF